MVVVVDLRGQPHFFIGAAMSLGISRVISLAISRAVLMGTDVAIGFFELSL